MEIFTTMFWMCFFWKIRFSLNQSTQLNWHFQLSFLCVPNWACIILQTVTLSLSEQFLTKMVHIVLEVITLILHLNWILIKSMIGLFFSPKRKDVTGKVILLTGSAHGIGKEMATMFYKLGAHLALIDINQVLNV